MDTTCKIVIVEGTPVSGKSTLARALATDLGLPLQHGTRGFLDVPEPFVADEFHLAEAVRIARGHSDLDAVGWATLDELVARRFGRIVLLVDTPAAIAARAAAWDSVRDLGREGVGQHLQAVTQALSASCVARRGSYTLKQFMDPQTGEKTPQYQRLLETIRREMCLEDRV